MADPEKRKRVFDSIVRNGFFVIVLLIAVGGIYYAYKKGLFSSAKQEETKEEPKEEAPVTRKPKKEPPKKVEENKSSLLIVSNDRFQKVSVFADGERIGEVKYRETEKILIPPTPQGKSVMISFEVNMPTGHRLPDATKAALSKGVPFSGTTKQGAKVIFAGPDADMTPSPDEVLSNVLVDLEVIKDSVLNVGLISAVKYKDCVIKPVAPQTKLHLAFGKTDTKTVVNWIVQEVVVERSGKKAYEPNAIPFEKSSVDIAVKDGVLDVKN
jgi:hypothetical protein